MTVHILKCWPEHFQALKQGDKTGELRLNDRDYQVGDTLHMREWVPDLVEPKDGRHTGDFLDLLVTHILPGGGFGLAPDYVMMSVQRMDSITIPLPASSLAPHLAAHAGTRRKLAEEWRESIATHDGPEYAGSAERAAGACDWVADVIETAVAKVAVVPRPPEGGR